MNEIIYPDIFVNNKYTIWYLKIVNIAKSRTIDCYLEKHHVIPQSFKIPSEIVMLTAKEHYICHLLLTKMCISKKHHFKMLNAFQMMANCHAANQQRYTSAAMYALLKENISSAKREMYSGEENPFYGKKHSSETMTKMLKNRPSMIGENNPNYGKKHSPETRQKISEKRKGKGSYKGPNNSLYGRTLSDDHKLKLSIAGKGRIVSPTTRKKLSENKLGCKNPNFGKPIDDSTKEKLSLALKGRQRSNEHKILISRQKSYILCQKLYIFYETITPENILDAKQRGLIAKSSPSYEKILLNLGEIPLNQ